MRAFRKGLHMNFFPKSSNCKGEVSEDDRLAVRLSQRSHALTKPMALEMKKGRNQIPAVTQS